ncbi:MAG: YabP/YqfC family sporulation protein [Bacillota bacterium]|nr:YabP/YqfC family sporulation protein [Bacillota bacterium]
MADNSRRRRLAAGKQTAARMERVADALDISKEFLAGSVKVTVIGTAEITVEGDLSIIEYTEEILRLNTRSFMLTITGRNFEVTDMDTDYLRLIGEIGSVGYMT